MSTIKKHRATIIISLIIGIFIFYSEPILTRLGDVIVDFFIYISDSFSQSYYMSIAKNDPYAIQEFTLFIIITGALYLFTTIYSSLTKRRNDLLNDAKNLLERVQSLKEKLKASKVKESFNEETILYELETLESGIGPSSKDLTKMKKSFNIVGLYFILFGGFLMVSFLLNRSISQENVVFKNKMTIIRPFVGSDKVYKLESDWAMMSNVSDYNKIDESIEAAMDELVDE